MKDEKCAWKSPSSEEEQVERGMVRDTKVEAKGKEQVWRSQSIIKGEVCKRIGIYGKDELQTNQTSEISRVQSYVKDYNFYMNYSYNYKTTIQDHCSYPRHIEIDRK